MRICPAERGHGGSCDGVVGRAGVAARDERHEPPAGVAARGAGRVRCGAVCGAGCGAGGGGGKDPKAVGGSGGLLRLRGGAVGGAETGGPRLHGRSEPVEPTRRHGDSGECRWSNWCCSCAMCEGLAASTRLDALLT